MASTRNRNCPGDYILEQKMNAGQSAYPVQTIYGTAKHIRFAGDGLIMGHMPSNQLSGNSCDIESQLFGIGSTNLVQPKGPVRPDIHKLDSLSIIDRLPIMVPEPLFIEANQRPLRQ